MIKKMKHIFYTGIISAFALGMLAGCGSKETKTEDTNATVNEAVVEATDSTNNASTEAVEATESEDIAEVTYPITIKHAFGETVIESKPERIATVAWANQDVPLALGVVPVGISKANFGVSDDSGLLPWTKEAYETLGATDINLYDDVDGLDFEAISDSNPDVILCSYSGITQEEYDLLSAIAPVVAYPELAWQTYWREQTMMNAIGMGLETEGSALVAETENLIKEKVTEYNVAGTKAGFFWINAADLGTFYVYLPEDPRAAYLEDLGLEFPESLRALATPESGIALTLSAENADVLADLDIIITYGNTELLDALQADPILGQVPAIKNGAVVLLDGTSSLAAACTPSVLSIPSTIDEYLTLIQEAVVKVK